METFIVNCLNCLITALLGFYLVKTIIKSEVKLLSVRTIAWLLAEVIITALLQQSSQITFNPLIVFCVNIIVYKMIFYNTINESIVVVGISTILMLVGDVVASIICSFFFTIKQIKTNSILLISVNLIVSAVTILLFNIRIVKNSMQKFYKASQTKQRITNIIFLILTIIISCILGYNLYKVFQFNYEYVSNLGIIVILMLLILIYVNNKNSYDQLSDRHEKLLDYFQTFEEQIEKEEFDRHEFKNHLAVINGMTKEKKVKDKIKEILKENLSSEEAIGQFKNLPKGGMKGLMYYKLALAKSNKIRLTFDIRLNKNNILKKLSDEENNVLCKLIGVYFDNAIEAAMETKKKEVMVEIYEAKEDLKIVITNTFVAGKGFERRNEKGISSKGKNRGKGLYFANRLLNKNNWIEGNQTIINDYYIQELIIKKKREK